VRAQELHRPWYIWLTKIYTGTLELHYTDFSMCRLISEPDRKKIDRSLATVISPTNYFIHGKVLSSFIPRPSYHLLAISMPTISTYH
jgi:hypothetical protein